MTSAEGSRRPSTEIGDTSLAEMGSITGPPPSPLDGLMHEAAEADLGVEFSVLAEEVLAVKVTGEIDVISAGEFGLALGDVLGNARAAAVVDLTDVTFIGSAGISALARFHRQAPARGITWALAGSHAVLRPVRLLRLELPTCDSASAALALLHAPSAASTGPGHPRRPNGTEH